MMVHGGTLRDEPRTGRKAPWVRGEKRHARKVKTIDGAERKRDRQLEAFRKAGLSGTVQGDAAEALRVHAVRGTIK